MSKKKKRKTAEPLENTRPVYDPLRDVIRFKGHWLSMTSIEAFFGLAALNKIMRIRIDKGNKVQVERVPENVEAFFNEIATICETYAAKPEQGFKEVVRTVKFVERIGQASVPPDRPGG